MGLDKTLQQFMFLVKFAIRWNSEFFLPIREGNLRSRQIWIGGEAGKAVSA
jgi:hypothetical protein